MNRIKFLLLLLVFLSLSGGSALADNFGTYDFGTLGVADTSRVDNVLQLTQNPNNDESQCWGAYPWSPDGERIVYQAEIGGIHNSDYNEICTMNNSGGSWQRLTNNDTCDSHPSFTPDGDEIIFQRRVNGYGEIFIMDADGSDDVSLTDAHGGAVLGYCESHPRVSPDGSMIAFHACNDGSTREEIWVMDIDGSDPVLVSQEGRNANKHSWSPDSRWVLYNSGIESTTGSSNIYRVRPDGSNREQLTDDNGIAENWAFWSPDGEWIAYHTKDQTGTYPVHTLSMMRPNGSSKVVVVTETDDNIDWDTVCGPKSWSPDSEWLGFKKNHSNNQSSIFVLNRSSLNIYQLTQDFNDYRLWWSPNNTQILFRDWGSNRDEGQNGYDLLVLNLDESYFPEYDQQAYATAIPTLSEWGMIVFSLLLAASAVIMMRKKQNA